MISTPQATNHALVHCEAIPQDQLCASAYRTSSGKCEIVARLQAALPTAYRSASGIRPESIVAQACLSQRADDFGDVRPAATAVIAFSIFVGRNTVNSSSSLAHSLAPAWLALPLSMLLAASASAQGVPLGTAGNFGVLAGSEVTNTGPSIVYGSVGVWPGTAIGGFPPGSLFPGSGAFHSADTVAQQAQFDLGVAYDDASGRACDVSIAGGLLGGLTLTPGVYCMGSADLTGTLTLDGAGVYVFQIASGLVTAPGSSVVMINGAGSCDVFWQVTSSAAIDTTSQMAGTILALTSITLNTNASLSGRALARNALVSQSSNNITQCTSGGSTGTGGGAQMLPTLSEWALAMLASLLVLVSVVAVRRRTSH
jgi:hypothetical protein